MKRHESLVPLSREHHHGLALCLGIHREIEKHQGDAIWLSKSAEKVVRFFESDLRPHFEAEQNVVFPAMSTMEDAKAIVVQLKDEHRLLEKFADRLRNASPQDTAPLLREFADLLEAHIRKEERVLFPCYELNISTTEADRVGNRIREIVGTGMTPKCPV